MVGTHNKLLGEAAAMQPPRTDPGLPTPDGKPEKALNVDPPLVDAPLSSVHGENTIEHMATIVLLLDVAQSAEYPSTIELV